MSHTSFFTGLLLLLALLLGACGSAEPPQSAEASTAAALQPVELPTLTPTLVQAMAPTLPAETAPVPTAPAVSPVTDPVERTATSIPAEAATEPASADAAGSLVRPISLEEGTELLGFALPDDASNMLLVQDQERSQVLFDSASAPEQLAAFFRQELPAQGWVERNANQINGLQVLTFGQSDQVWVVKIKQGSVGASVQISQEPAEE